MLGAVLGVVLVYAQRHVVVWLLGMLAGVVWLLRMLAGVLAFLSVVWLLGMLAGVLAFLSVFVGTTLLATLPHQAVIAIGVASGLAGSSAMLKLEQTLAWKALACAVVGAILLSDAAGMRAAPPLAQAIPTP
ncbi:hypothetical protein T484DRAFT_1775257 [Baffinella frigidus]|nr:hypothetical protein T484DRAFT_1775257 [Cryptophyta sp. CCMP2293]